MHVMKLNGEGLRYPALPRARLNNAALYITALAVIFGLHKFSLSLHAATFNGGMFLLLGVAKKYFDHKHAVKVRGR